MNTSQANVTVVLPAYNVEKYIDDALTSLLEQTLPPRQIIVVDDGSTDATAERVRRFQDDHDIQLITQSNAGPGPARNAGALLATSDYLYFLDADDRLDRDFLKKIEKSIEDYHNPDLIAFSGNPFVEEGFVPPVAFDYRRAVTLKNVDGVFAMKKLLQQDAFYSQISLHLIRKEHWFQSELRFPAGFHEDEDVLVPLFASAQTALVLDDVFFYRRVRRESVMTMAKTVSHVYGRERNVRYALQALHRTPGSDEQLRRLLRSRCEMFAKLYIELANETGTRLKFLLLIRVAYRRRSRSFNKKLRKQFLKSIQSLYLSA